jgi:hypothetical protein
LGVYLAYRRDFAASARRHFRSALLLHKSVEAGAQPGCQAVAGYIFGVVGELALKEIMRPNGLREMPVDRRKDDPFYAHFPSLKSLLAEQLRARKDSRLHTFADSEALFSNWNTKMRYAPTDDIQKKWVDSWKKSAEVLMAEMDSV